MYAARSLIFISVGLRSESRNLKVGIGKSHPFTFCSAVLGLIPKNSSHTHLSSITGVSNRASNAKFVFIYHLCNYPLMATRGDSSRHKVPYQELEVIINPNMEPCQMNYGKKIKILRESLNKTQQDFANMTSISLSTLKKVEGGFSNVGISIIDKIIATPSLEEHVLWFMTGTEDLNTEPKDISVIEHIHLPFYEISASAGDGALVEVEEQANMISFEPEWLNKEIGVNPNDVFLMLVEGDSMYPTLKCGSMIMVNRNLSGLSDGIYVMRQDHHLLVKRLQMLPGGIIKVISDNSMYEPWEIDKKLLNGIDIELIGRVVWSGQRM